MHSELVCGRMGRFGKDYTLYACLTSCNNTFHDYEYYAIFAAKRIQCNNGLCQPSMRKHSTFKHINLPSQTAVVFEPNPKFKVLARFRVGITFISIARFRVGITSISLAKGLVPAGNSPEGSASQPHHMLLLHPFYTAR